MLALAQPFQVQQEFLQEAEFRFLPVRAGRARGQVHRHNPQLAEARLDIASLGIELPAGESAPHLVRILAAVERDPAVALLLGKRMAGLESLQAVQPGIEIGLLALHFLQADHIRALRGQPAEQALVRGGTDAVDVESDDSQEEGKAETPPCAADHCAGACKNFSTSAI